MQIMARQALTRGLLRFDRKHGFRGPVTRIAADADWGERNCEVAHGLRSRAPGRSQWFSRSTAREARIGLRPRPSADGKSVGQPLTGAIPLELMAWARKPAADGAAAPRVLLQATY